MNSDRQNFVIARLLLRILRLHKGYMPLGTMTRILERMEAKSRRREQQRIAMVCFPAGAD